MGVADVDLGADVTARHWTCTFVGICQATHLAAYHTAP